MYFATEVAPTAWQNARGTPRIPTLLFLDCLWRRLLRNGRGKNSPRRRPSPVVVVAAAVVVVVVVVVALRLTRSCREQNWENATS